MILRLKYKIVGLVVLAALLPVLVMSVLIFMQKDSVENIIENEMLSLTKDNLKYIAKDVSNMCKLANSRVSQEINSNLNVAEKLLNDAGGIHLQASDPITWKAVNQLNGEIKTVTLPKMFIGMDWLGQNTAFDQPTLLVDDVEKLVGDTCTVFQKMNVQGDMLRVATNVKTSDGARAISTFIPAVEPDGKPNPVINAVMSGETYRGGAFVVNAWYIAAYKPIKDKNGEIIGCLYVGIKLEAMDTIRNVIQDIVIGKTGYVAVLGGTGKKKGSYIISYKGERDGENIYDLQDSKGTFFGRDLVEMSIKNPSDISYLDYYLKNPSDPHPRKKLGASIYFEPWDWVIVATMYIDDYHDAQIKVDRSLTYLLLSVSVGGFIILIIVSIFAVFLGARIGNPVSRITEIAGCIADGNLSEAQVSLTPLVLSYGRGKDETGSMIRSFETMTKNLNSLVSQVQQSSIQLVSTATQIAASSKEQEATVSEFSASTSQIVSSSKEITSTSQQLVETMKDVAQVSKQTADLADYGQSGLNEMESTMEQLAGATTSISSKLSVINEKANNINNVVITITKVADQTNLLSLNASIEAEKAGEYGLGFSVVAREIRRLADQTAVATLDIAKMVREMQSSVSSGVMEMDKFSEEVRHGVKEVSKISSHLEKIIQQVQCLPPKFDQVTEGMKGQSEGAQQISESIMQLNEAARQTTESLREFNEATVQLNQAAQSLQKEVSIFKVG